MARDVVDRVEGRRRRRPRVRARDTRLRSLERFAGRRGGRCRPRRRHGPGDRRRRCQVPHTAAEQPQAAGGGRRMGAPGRGFGSGGQLARRRPGAAHQRPRERPVPVRISSTRRQLQRKSRHPCSGHSSGLRRRAAAAGVATVRARRSGNRGVSPNLRTGHLAGTLRITPGFGECDARAIRGGGRIVGPELDPRRVSAAPKSGPGGFPFGGTACGHAPTDSGTGGFGVAVHAAPTLDQASVTGERRAACGTSGS